jgi:hypothetical protein
MFGSGNKMRASANAPLSRLKTYRKKRVNYYCRSSSHLKLRGGMDFFLHANAATQRKLLQAARLETFSGTVATVGFPNIGLQGFAPKLAKGEIASLTGAADDARYFQISVVLADDHHAAGSLQRVTVRAARW